ncbi:glutamate 5-kinase [Chelatococcus sambhunathii]|uniref:Glutamate 5-kinase n=1 Tax=Chelatococcus sambhunathii TaxID=363953 RepID=A0ABU1DF72_9HYPH|nr:glutamate 5-kinase [Chelatococcus sambhunathii]MDR4306742.1 glutamate 5-kinase [Chelatococcus sambhunathii]
MTLPSLASFRRIVVKIGSALLVDQARGELKRAWLESLAADLARHAARGAEVVVVSSGSIALGRTILKLPRGALRLEDSQAAAAVGQIALARAWSEALGAHGISAGQVLLTLGDTEERRRFLNARATLARLLALKCVPVVNENDTVATQEIRYGDNDRLAARVASMADADCLVLLSDIDGLYSAPPAQDPTAELIPLVERVTPAIEAIAGGAASEYSRGGMRTKIEAARIATGAGVAMLIASGHVMSPLSVVEAGGRCTWFLAQESSGQARKKWIAGVLAPKGEIHVDAGAASALNHGRSLLPAGIVRIAGHFSRGDAVIVRAPDGVEVARGLASYDSADANRLKGKPSAEIESVLGFKGRPAIIHRDDLVLTGA